MNSVVRKSFPSSLFSTFQELTKFNCPYLFQTKLLQIMYFNNLSFSLFYHFPSRIITLLCWRASPNLSRFCPPKSPFFSPQWTIWWNTNRNCTEQRLVWPSWSTASTSARKLLPGRHSVPPPCHRPDRAAFLAVVASAVAAAPATNRRDETPHTP